MNIKEEKMYINQILTISYKVNRRGELDICGELKE